MELAIMTLRLSGQTQNTVIKEDVSPAQAAIYQYMHGEDCIESLQVTSIDKQRTIEDEMNRLSTVFVSDHSKKVMARLFPGHAPRLPATFNQVGIAADRSPAAAKQPIWQESEAKAAAPDLRVVDAIRAAATARQTTAPEATPPVYAHTIADHFDNSGAPDGDLHLSDDPLDLEIRQLKQAGQE